MKQFTFNYLRRLAFMLLTVVGFTATTLAQEWENVTTVNYTSQEEIDNAKNDGSLLHKANEDKPMVYQNEMIQVAFSGYTEYLAFKVDVNESGTYKMSLDMYNQDYLNEINFQFRYHSSSFSSSDGTLISPESIKWPLNNRTTIESNEFNLEPGTYYFAYHRNKFVDGMMREHFNNFKLFKKKITHAVTLNKPENGNLSVTYNNGTDNVTVSTDTEAQTFNVAENTKLTVTATAAEGYELASLSPTMTKVPDSENVYEYTVTGAVNIEATFIYNPIIGVGTDSATAPIVSTASSPTWFVMKSSHLTATERQNRFMYWNNENNRLECTQHNDGIKLSEISDSYRWRFEDAGDGNIYIINKATGKALSVPANASSETGNANVNTPLTLEETGSKWSFALSSTVNPTEALPNQYCFDYVDYAEADRAAYLNAMDGQAVIPFGITIYEMGVQNASGWFIYEAPVIVKMYNITVSKPVNGSLFIEYTVNDETQEIDTETFENDSEVFSIPENTIMNIYPTAEYDYELDQILPEGMEEKTDMRGRKYYVLTVTEDATIEATFKAILYGIVSITEPEETQGSIEIEFKNPMSGEWQVADDFYLGAVEFDTELRAKVEAKTGYTVKTVMKGETVINKNDDGYYYFTVDAEEICISAEFEAEEYTLTTKVTPEEGGSVSVIVDGESVEGTVKYRDVFTVAVTENTGYTHESTVVEGAEEIDGQAGIYTVKGNVTITVTFKKETSSINSIENGAVYYNTEEKVLYTGAAKSARVYDLSGRLVLNAENQENISLAELSEGVYTAVVDGKVIKLNK